MSVFVISPVCQAQHDTWAVIRVNLIIPVMEGYWGRWGGGVPFSSIKPSVSAARSSWVLGDAVATEEGLLERRVDEADSLVACPVMNLFMYWKAILHPY